MGLCHTCLCTCLFRTGPPSYLGILLHQLGEVGEQAVLGPQEVKLVVALLLLHELCEELAAISGHKLGRQLHHVEVEGRNGGWVCDELKFRRGLFGHHSLVNHLSLDLPSDKQGRQCRPVQLTVIPVAPSSSPHPPQGTSK